ncbi:hypothetical protein TWF281_005214 [Arthrobotrys megalospora]
MPPKKAPKPTSSSSEEDGSSIPPVESSAIKKSRGRPRKQQHQPAPAASVIPEDTDDSLAPPPPPEMKKPPVERKEKGKAVVVVGGGEPPTKSKIANPTKAVPSRKRAVEQKLEIPETQAVREEASQSEDEDMDISQDEESDPPPARRKNQPSKVGKASGKPDPDALADELAQLKIKYEKLRRLRTDDADAIHREQIKALEERDKASQRIIENLKSELKSRSISLQQLQEKDQRIQELEKQNSLMEDKIERLLQDHAVLSAKLETARNIGKTPSNNSKAIVTGGASKEFSQHRENLYSDLCGLIVVNVKSDEDGGIEYDCLSTGKNGALHFKLQLDAEDDDDEADDDGPYFTYNPMLERGRDERLIAVLPPIFRDEMNFKRTRGVDFYLQLMQSLQSS